MTARNRICFHPGGSFHAGDCPESGMIPEGTVFDRISIGHPEGAEMAVNPESDGTATLTCAAAEPCLPIPHHRWRHSMTRRHVCSTSPVSMLRKKAFTNSSLPAGMLHEKGYVTTNTDLTATYQVDPSSRLESVSGDGSVLAFAVRGRSHTHVGHHRWLHRHSMPSTVLGGVGAGIWRVRNSRHRHIRLQRGIYAVLNVDGKSFKITI